MGIAKMFPDKPRMNLQELRLRVDYVNRCTACAALSIHPFIGFVENRYSYVDHQANIHAFDTFSRI
jgi:hypothetical protein